LDRFKTVLESYSSLVRENIEVKIRETGDSLVKSLLPRVQADPPREWQMSSLTGTPTPEQIRRKLENVIDQAFTKVDQTFSPKVVCIFKGVRYETIIEDPEFRERLIEHFGEEGEAKLYDASRAEDPTPA
jgi:hypothetical protein